VRLLLTFAGALLLTLAFGPAQPASAQGEDGLPNVFFDCNGRNCNSNYYRTEIGWVNWVRDRNDADIHLIMTSQTTGPGGREYQLDFIGVGDREGYLDQMRYQTLPTDTDREQLDGIAFSISIGMARFATTAGFRDLVTLQGRDPELGGQTRVVSQEEVDDPWNLWYFRLNGSTNVNGEETRDNRRVNGSLNASRVSPTWKLNFNGNFNYNRQRVDLDDGEFVDSRTDWGFRPLIVYSLAENWSIGIQGDAGRQTRQNQRLRVEFTPAIEYSFFPYAEATRRALTAFYKIGPTYRDYYETTVFGEESETRFEQSLELEFSQRQQWGDASVSFEVSHFLHDLDRNRRSIDGNVDFRIVRGLSVNARGNIEWVDDQIYLSADGATNEEALLQLRQRGSDFNWFFNVGFSIQFGSIFNNVVNNRFGGGGGGGGFRFF
jgi:hypothetical protein